MTPAEAIELAVQKFPFQGYMTLGAGAKGAFMNIAGTPLRYLQPGSKILDFGCGPCDKTSILALLGFKCSGYDDLQDDWHKIPANREKIISFAKESGIDLHLASGGIFPFPKHSFDMVMLHDVIEHLHDSPRELISDLLELAKPEGLLFITVPNAVNIRKRVAVLFGKTNLPPFDSYYWYPSPWRGHIREYVKDDLVRLSKYLDLDVLELRSCDHMLEKLPAFVRPAYLFATAIFPSWKDSWMLVARKKSDWTPKKEIPPERLVQIAGTARH